MLKINFPPTSEAVLNYTDMPWVDANGQSWIYSAAKNRWTISASGSYVLALNTLPISVAAHMTISGVGTSGVNGLLIYCGNLNGKPSYTNTGLIVGSGEQTELSWTGTRWKLERFAPSQVFEAVAVGSTAAAPDGLTFTVYYGTSTPPTVTASTTVVSNPAPLAIGQTAIVSHSDNTKTEWGAVSLNEWLPRTAGIISHANGYWYRHTLNSSGVSVYEILPDQLLPTEF